MQQTLNEVRQDYYGLTDCHRRDLEYTKLIGKLKDIEEVLSKTEKERSKQ